jgi:hypothetical protein
MASMSVSERDFITLASAAMAAKLLGKPVAAKDLDVLARKASAALTNASSRRRLRNIPMATRPTITWKEVPSTFEWIKGYRKHDDKEEIKKLDSN